MYLGSTEQYFLYLVSISPISASGILTELQYVRQGEPRSKKKQKTPMGYSNVHKRVKRLEDLKLIEFEGEYSRNEIKYKITSHGLFQLMLRAGLGIEGILANNDDILVQTLLYQFFEMETIKQFITVPRRMVLKNYLRSCSNAILKKLEELNAAPYEFSPHEILPSFENLILREIQKLVFLIVVQSRATALTEDPDQELGYLNDRGIWNATYSNDNDQNIKERSALFPNQALMNDRKFMEMLSEIVKEFDNGCKVFRRVLPK